MQGQVKWRAMHFLLVCVNENFKNQYSIEVQLIQVFPQKVNEIVKANTNSVENTCEYAHCWCNSEEKQQKIINTRANKNIFLKG